MIYTTLNDIDYYEPCAEGWQQLLKGLGKTRADDEPLALSTVLDINGLDDTLWCLRCVPGEASRWRLYAVWCARQVQHLLLDIRSLAAIDVAERYAQGMATDEELSASCTGAWAAVVADASVGGGAPAAAAWAADRDAAVAALLAADSAGIEARAVGAAAWVDAQAAMLAQLRRVLTTR